MALFFVGFVAFIAGVSVGLVLASDAPRCVCGDVECGGGCIDWERAS